MPRGKLSEAHVKQTAVEWLANSYYRNLLDAEIVVSGMEAIVSKNGFGRADGLIAAKLRNGNIYTISIEAKSSRTWRNLIAHQDQLGMFFHATIFAILVVIMLMVFGFISSTELMQGIISPIALITVIGYSFINYSPIGDRYRVAKVVKQVEGYPANEKWIALSTDIYNRLVNENQVSHFEKICMKRGIGLIRVTSSIKSVVVVSPKPTPTPKNIDSFLVCYARAQVIRDKIALAVLEPNVIPTPLVLDNPEKSDSEVDSIGVVDAIFNVEDDESPYAE